MARTPAPISNSDDIIDSRDVIARINYLEDEIGNFEEDPEWPLDEPIEDTRAELKLLLVLKEEAEGYSEWEHGAAMIRDSYFENYAREFAEDIGAVSRNEDWPKCHIDWEAAADSLRQDYTSVEFDGVTYWVR